MPLYKMSELAPLALAEINEIIRLAGTKEKHAKPKALSALKVKRARGKQLKLKLEL